MGRDISVRQHSKISNEFPATSRHCRDMTVRVLKRRKTEQNKQTYIYFIPLKPGLGGVCSLAKYSVACEETQSNRVSDFRDLVCSLFPKATLFDFC